MSSSARAATDQLTLDCPAAEKGDRQSATAAQQSATAQQQAAAAQQPAAPAPTAMVASLPEGCVSAGSVFQCGNVYYKPYMSGNQIVYGVVPGP